MGTQRPIWVMEWFHKQNGWIPISGDNERKFVWRKVKEERAKHPTEKFRTKAYVPREATR